MHMQPQTQPLTVVMARAPWSRGLGVRVQATTAALGLSESAVPTHQATKKLMCPSHHISHAYLPVLAVTCLLCPTCPPSCYHVSRMPSYLLSHSLSNMPE